MDSKWLQKFLNHYTVDIVGQRPCAIGAVLCIKGHFPNPSGCQKHPPNIDNQNCPPTLPNTVWGPGKRANHRQLRATGLARGLDEGRGE